MCVAAKCYWIQNILEMNNETIKHPILLWRPQNILSMCFNSAEVGITFCSTLRLHSGDPHSYLVQFSGQKQKKIWQQNKKKNFKKKKKEM